MKLPRSWRRAPTSRPRAFRYERFGGIVQLGLPRALVFVDRDRARALGYKDGGALWAEPEVEGVGGALPAGVLAAPLEAHLQLTNRCGAGCRTCYTGATPMGGPSEYGLADWKHALDELAGMGVFHVALGGGESALLPWLHEIVDHARAIGLVPNLTTSGLYSDEELSHVVALAPRRLKEDTRHEFDRTSHRGQVGHGHIGPQRACVQSGDWQIERRRCFGVFRRG